MTSGKKVIVKKTRFEREGPHGRLIYVLYNVCEIIDNDTGPSEFNVWQVWDVIEHYDVDSWERAAHARKRR